MPTCRRADAERCAPRASRAPPRHSPSPRPRAPRRRPRRSTTRDRGSRLPARLSTVLSRQRSLGRGVSGRTDRQFCRRSRVQCGTLDASQIFRSYPSSGMSGRSVRIAFTNSRLERFLAISTTWSPGSMKLKIPQNRVFRRRFDPPNDIHRRIDPPDQPTEPEPPVGKQHGSVPPCEQQAADPGSKRDPDKLSESKTR